MTLSRLLPALAALFLGSVSAADASMVNGTGLVTNNVIFGAGNANGAFTGGRWGSLELGLRAKLRYDASTACAGGYGCPQNTFNYTGGDTYSFTSAQSNAPANRSIFNFEWSINTNADGLGMALSGYTYRIDIDTDPTTHVGGLVSYNPMSFLSTGYYLGTNASPAGGATFRFGGTGNLSAYNLAQNSVNLGFLPGTNLGPGQFGIYLSAFNATTGQLAGSASINVNVDSPAPVPLPAGAGLLVAALGGLAALRRKMKTNA
ncbi:MAG: VPLPA-CTERM sorting domain-containing protein [Proteobacteria bacterium]|nr:VPLPA-CTERM sorting domain-containing protein [Pseudomonadota bacterium]MBS0572898.1 VPLPA-CTERM sorting domain-containing protein [Pseudomonadota bacterium]